MLQGSNLASKNILFLCSKNRRRSPKAEDIFIGHPNIQVRSAGLSNDADEQCSTEDIEWAHMIFVMNEIHRRKLSKDFGRDVRNKDVINLAIPDNYDPNDPELAGILRRRIAAHLPVQRPKNLASAKNRGTKNKLTHQ